MFEQITSTVLTVTDGLAAGTTQLLPPLPLPAPPVFITHLGMRQKDEKHALKSLPS